MVVVVLCSVATRGVQVGGSLLFLLQISSRGLYYRMILELQLLLLMLVVLIHKLKVIIFVGYPVEVVAYSRLWQQEAILGGCVMLSID